MIFTPKGFLAISFGGFFKSANVAFLKELTPQRIYMTHFEHVCFWLTLLAFWPDLITRILGG